MQYSAKLKKDALDREAKLTQHSPGKTEKATNESKVEVLEKLGE